MLTTQKRFLMIIYVSPFIIAVLCWTMFHHSAIASTTLRTMRQAFVWVVLADMCSPLLCDFHPDIPMRPWQRVCMKVSRSAIFQLSLTSQGRTNGSSIRYIAMVSIKVKDVECDETSIAHFYRYLELWPLLDPLRILSPSPTPVYANTSKGVFLGGPGTIKLTASIHRETWVAGQRCFVKVFIANDTEKKRVQSVTLNLIRTETMFVPNPDAAIQDGALVHNDSDACHTSTTKRIVSKSVLEMGESAVSRHVTASGWWTGVPPSSSLEFNHNILIPVRLYTVIRGLSEHLPAACFNDS